MSVKVGNTLRLKRRLLALPMEARQGIGKALAASVVELDAHAKQQISGGGRSGRVYKRRSVRHQASAPGEFPKTDTGQLVASLFFRLGADRLSAFFGSTLLYAKYLELKAVQKGGRPWLEPTYKAKEEGILNRVKVAVKEAAQKACTHA